MNLTNDKFNVIVCKENNGIFYVTKMFIPSILVFVIYFTLPPDKLNKIYALYGNFTKKNMFLYIGEPLPLCFLKM